MQNNTTVLMSAYAMGPKILCSIYSLILPIYYAAIVLFLFLKWSYFSETLVSDSIRYIFQ